MQQLTPDRALTELATQHAALRRMMARCEDLADELDATHGDPLPLTHEIARLRVAFSTHNEFEEHLLRPLLLQEDAFANVRIDRMIADHIREHAEMRTQLHTEQTGPLREVIANLRAHLDAEERYLVSAKVLHDGLVTVEGGG
jgi:iron-sulfur cluster repair protein YtfE (RIC family)